jgi:hypothetical protein
MEGLLESDVFQGKGTSAKWEEGVGTGSFEGSLEEEVKDMATIVIHWKDKNFLPMEIENAAYKGGDSSIIKITSGGKEYWFNWSECWFLESAGIDGGKLNQVELPSRNR